MVIYVHCPLSENASMFDTIIVWPMRRQHKILYLLNLVSPARSSKVSGSKSRSQGGRCRCQCLTQGISKSNTNTVSCIEPKSLAALKYAGRDVKTDRFTDSDFFRLQGTI